MDQTIDERRSWWSILRRADQKPGPVRIWRTEAGDVRNDSAVAAEIKEWLRVAVVRSTKSAVEAEPDRVAAGSN